MRRGMKFSCSGNLATMAPGLPYAIGAQAAYPDRQVVAFVGDGGFTMLMGDFVTAVKHELPIKVVIIKNNTLGQIKWEQMVFLGNPEYEVELHPIDFVKFAEACGGVGFRCERPEEVRPALEAAFAVEQAGDRRGGRSTRSSRRCPPQATPKQALQVRRVAGPRRAGRAARSSRRSSRTRSRSWSEAGLGIRRPLPPGEGAAERRVRGREGQGARGQTLIRPSATFSRGEKASTRRGKSICQAS